jgi:hypothetical protein
MKTVNLFTFSLLLTATAFFTACDKDTPSPSGNGSLSVVANELSKDADFKLFAEALANTGVQNEAENYTLFALPDSIIKMDGTTISGSDIQWHIIQGKYTSEQLLQAKTLQTAGGQTLTVVSETAEMDGEQQTLLYINDVPVNYQSRRLLGETVVYPIGSNIAKISNPPDVNDLDAYNSYLTVCMAGKWQIMPLETREYYIWSGSGRDSEPYSVETYDTHSHCYEIFKRNPEKASQGFAGTYESHHPCGSVIRYAGSSTIGQQHSSTGWWKVSEGGISFKGANHYENDWFNFDESSWNGRKLRPIIHYTTGRGNDHYYGGDEDVIIGTYYERSYTLRKIPY